MENECWPGQVDFKDLVMSQPLAQPHLERPLSRRQLTAHKYYYLRRVTASCLDASSHVVGFGHVQSSAKPHGGSSD